MKNKYVLAVSRFLGSVGIAMLVSTGNAFAGPPLPSGGGDLFAKAKAWFQFYVDFMTGPFGWAIVIVSAVIVLATWAIIPKDGFVGNALRVVVAGLGIVNIATVMGSFS